MLWRVSRYPSHGRKTMNSTRIYAIFIRQVLLVWHNKTRFVNIFLWFGLDILLWGFTTTYLNTLGYAAFDFVPVLLGAVILWSFLTAVQQGVMRAFFEDVWSHNFLNLFASPLTVGEYLAGLILSSIASAVIGFVFMLAVALPFGYSIFPLGLYALPCLLILFLFGLALGIFTTALVLRLGPAAEWFAWPVPFIIQPFAGVFYPISSLPAVLQPVAKAIPPAYAFEGMRELLGAGSVSLSNLVWGGLSAMVYVILTYLFFLHIYGYVLKTGLLTRFSAENG